MTFDKFNDDWKFWIWDNVHRGSPKKELANILLEKGFDKQLIINELGVPNIFEADFAPTLDIKRLTQECKAKRISEDLNIFEVKHFLEPKECEQMIEIIRENCARSSVIDYDTGGESFSYFCTRSTAHLYRKMGEIFGLVGD